MEFFGYQRIHLRTAPSSQRKRQPIWLTAILQRLPTTKVFIGHLHHEISQELKTTIANTTIYNAKGPVFKFPGATWMKKTYSYAQGIITSVLVSSSSTYHVFHLLDPTRWNEKAMKSGIAYCLKLFASDFHSLAPCNSNINNASNDLKCPKWGKLELILPE